ncbi:MAG: UvrD-helicase domain-containing protein [Hydrogenophaga sp.]|uniref:UvrD family DEAD/DEAH box helicase n=1 Tax=Hydrogenophaga sp. TaxID=1904254 RepID=UPI0025BC7CA0|nr:UvrD family DEAD/DEAH box helicase [Hydrogenophaga sp.]MBU4506662.1 UvrD-helicase domain-containing protein [Gammaproteobacteria bacterium]MCG2656312.1 UvrD-helicase domain-containing protein [Hydrogenophaga sp.]
MMVGPIIWTKEQQLVIQAQASARLIVDAGPGTGKTATLCARIAWLLETAKLEPGEIWIISFTRTAVAEIRSRVSSYLDHPAAIFGIKVATIDSHAWAMNVGFNEDAVLSGGFDDNIRKVIKTITSNEHAAEYIGSVKHLFIDEAQDVIGPRVELVLELINGMAASSGVTVLCDEAQAIYEYADAEHSGDLSGGLAQNIRKFFPAFVDAELLEVHRTSDPKLKQFFADGRAVVRNENLTGRTKYVDVRRAVVASSHGRLGDAIDDLRAVDELDRDTFLLFRRRGEALAASSYLKEVPHRLRMSGLPTVIEDWIGLIFWDWLEPRMSQDAFNSRWSRRVPMGGLSKLDAWARLFRVAGRSEGLLDIANLRRRLASLSPPVECCRPDFGHSGPIVGTIHGVKGREASQVRLYLPGAASMKTADDELFAAEAKVLFVGASRARDQLFIGRSFASYSSTLHISGRAYTRCASPSWSAQVEIGRAGDIDAEGLVGKKHFDDHSQARHAQALIMGIRRGMHFASACIGDKDSRYLYSVTLNARPEDRLMVFSSLLTRDLFYIAKNLRKRFAPSRIPGLRNLGLRTVVVSPDDPLTSALHHPWSESGFVLAPLLTGYEALAFR